MSIPRLRFLCTEISFYGPKIWNVVPVHIKTAANLNAFKYFIKTSKAFHATASSALISVHF